VEVTLEEDSEPRTIEIPADLMYALDTDSEAKVHFEKLSYTHRKEYVTWIDEAKKDETRQKRIAKTVEMLKQEKKIG